MQKSALFAGIGQDDGIWEYFVKIRVLALSYSKSETTFKVEKLPISIVKVVSDLL